MSEATSVTSRGCPVHLWDVVGLGSGSWLSANEDAEVLVRFFRKHLHFLLERRQPLGNQMDVLQDDPVPALGALLQGLLSHNLKERTQDNVVVRLWFRRTSQQKKSRNRK